MSRHVTRNDGLEVTQEDGLEVVREDSTLEYCGPTGTSIYPQSAITLKSEILGGAFYDDGKPQTKEKTICGLRLATFCLLITLILVVLIAAIGGGIGGTMAVKNARQ
jgi:hypothetical protein